MLRRYTFDNFFVSEKLGKQYNEYFGRIYRSTLTQWRNEGLTFGAVWILMMGTCYAQREWGLDDLLTFGFPEDEVTRALNELIAKEYAVKDGDVYRIKNDKRIKWQAGKSV